MHLRGRFRCIKPAISQRPKDATATTRRVTQGDGSELQNTMIATVQNAAPARSDQASRIRAFADSEATCAS